MSVDYYKTMRNHYSNANTYNALKKEMISEIQSNMAENLPDNLTKAFEVKIGMDYYKQKAIVNFGKEIDCYVELQRMKEKVMSYCRSRIISTKSPRIIRMELSWKVVKLFINRQSEPKVLFINN